MGNVLLNLSASITTREANYMAKKKLDPNTEYDHDYLPSKWLRIVIPIVLLGIWFAAASFGGPTFGKLSSVSSNDQAGFLPANSESTKVQAAQAKFTAAKYIPAIIVLESATKITPADLPFYLALVQQLGQVSGVSQPTPPATTTIVGPIPSADGFAIQYIVPVANTSDIKSVIIDLRKVTGSNLPEGVKAYVTGPAGLAADLFTAFGGVDGILLLVAISAVFIILLLVYRSIILPFLVLLTAVFALSAAILVVYQFALWGWIKLNGQSQGILSILVIGAATDYALLLSARYRESLEHVQSKWVAIQHAVKVSFEPISAAGATVVLALLCLLFSNLNSNRSLGPIAAIGIIFSYLAALSFLPVLLALFGRIAFWPFVPKLKTSAQLVDDKNQIAGLSGIKGIWLKIGTLIARRPRQVWFFSLLLLGVCMLGLPQLKASGVTQEQIILSKSNAVDGQKVVNRHFDAGSGSPIVIIADSATADEIVAATRAHDGISTVVIYSKPGSSGLPLIVDGKVLINATLKVDAESAESMQIVGELRSQLKKLDPSAIVGGVTATSLDTNTTATADLYRIIPIVLAVILIILILLLRAILAPILLIASVVVSYGAALGVSAFVFNHVFNFPGADAAVPLFGFIFLVALGVDYNIFLMTRVREESQKIGTRPGILRGLSVTGSVITSAGVVLAATFAALGVIPILFLAEIAFVVAFGVLLDTIIVRSLLIPALSYDIGRAIWWPSKLWRNGK
jgi:RND superfamily putative drug exporter